MTDIKVYIVGAHGAGKSTLARYISNQYKLPFLPETARMVLSERELQLDTLRYDLDTVDSYQQAVFDRQITEESKHASFVSDRCLLDVLAYSSEHSRILPKLLHSKELKQYVETLKKDNPIIFFVKPSKLTLKSDGIREALNWEAVIAIDAIIKFLLEMYELPHFQINVDSMQERVKLIDSILKIKQPR